MSNTDPTLGEVQARFANDRFATEACGCTVIEARDGHAVCGLTIGPSHLNAMGAVMGGAIFTLADFALAVASNLREHHVSVNSTIDFMSGVRGKRLFATCNVTKRGRTLSFYTVDVSDELSTPVARMNATCCRVG